MRSTAARIGIGAGLALAGALFLAVTAFALLRATAPEPEPAEGWALGPPLPTERGELATAVVHGAPCPEPPCPDLELLYVVGGLAGLGRAQDRVDRFDPAEGAWSERPPLPAPRHHLGAAGLGEALYVSGGTSDIGQPWTPEPNFWRLEEGGDAWEALPDMPEGRWGHRMAAHDGRLFVVGGMGPSSRVLIWEPERGWRERAEMPAPRDHLSVVVAGGRIWAIGGRHPESTGRVDVYDPDADRWEAGPDLPAPTSGAAEGVVNGVILVFGGEEPALRGGEVFDRHWRLDTGAAQPAWERAPRPPLAVHGADGAVFQGAMVIVGGAGRHGLLSLTSWTGAFQRMEAGVAAPP